MLAQIRPSGGRRSAHSSHDAASPPDLDVAPPANDAADVPLTARPRYSRRLGVQDLRQPVQEICRGGPDLRPPPPFDMYVLA
jgi:hypothetical protein